MFKGIVRLLPYQHCRVRLVVSRLLAHFLANLKVETVSVNAQQSRPMTSPRQQRSTRRHGMLSKVALLLCGQLDDAYLDDTTAKYIVRNFMYIIQIMLLAPQFFLPCNCQNGEDVHDDAPVNNAGGPVGWLVAHLSKAARRSAPISCSIIFQCFGIIVSCTHNTDILEPLVPVMVSTISKTLTSGPSTNENGNRGRQQQTKLLAREIMKMLSRCV